MKSMLVATILLLTFASTPVLAQDASMGSYLHGNWAIKGTIGEDQVSGNMHVSPAANGESQVYRWTIKFPDEVREGSAIGGIDPESGKVVEHAFGKSFYWKNTFDKNLGDSVGRATGTQVGMVRGKKYEGRITLDRTSEDKFHYDVESDDADDVHFVFTRRKVESDGESAFNAYADLAVGGTWTTTIDGVTYEDSYERIQDGQFVMLTSKPVGQFPASVTVLGVDPVTKKFTWWGFSADGTHSLGTSRQIKSGVWVGPFNSNGPKGEMTSRGKLTKVDKDTIKYEILEQTKDDGVPSFATFSTWKRKR